MQKVSYHRLSISFLNQFITTQYPTTQTTPVVTTAVAAMISTCFPASICVLLLLIFDFKGITPILRGNADIAIIYRQFQKNQRESLIEDFLDVLPTKDMARAMLDKFTKCKGDPAFDDPEHIVRQALCVCPSRLSIAPQNLCRIYNAQDPDKFDKGWKLGIDLFYQAARKGNMGMLIGTYKRPVKNDKKSKKRVK
jgi:hypothetical protein